MLFTCRGCRYQEIARRLGLRAEHGRNPPVPRPPSAAPPAEHGPCSPAQSTPAERPRAPPLFSSWGTSRALREPVRLTCPVGCRTPMRGCRAVPRKTISADGVGCPPERTLGAIGRLFLQTLATAAGSVSTTPPSRRWWWGNSMLLIVRLHREAGLAWLPVELPLETYARHLATCVAAAPTRSDPGKAGEALCTTDLYLACAAGTDIPAARELFVSPFPRADRRRGQSHRPGPGPCGRGQAGVAREPAARREEGASPRCQGQPRILQYGGRAPLASWVGVAAKRTALGLLRADGARRR